MFAVIKTGGKQYRVAADDKLKVEKIDGEPGQIIQFSEVLVVGGDAVTLGTPTITGASVAAAVIEQSRGALPDPDLELSVSSAELDRAADDLADPDCAVCGLGRDGP